MRDGLPVEGISFLLGNDMAGDKVTPNPIVTDIPIIEEVEGLVKLHPTVFSSCVVTRAIAKKEALKLSKTTLWLI